MTSGLFSVAVYSVISAFIFAEEARPPLPPDNEYVTVGEDGRLELDGRRVRYWGVIGSFPNHPKFEETDSEAQRKARVKQSQAETDAIVQRFVDLGFNFCRYWRGFREPVDYVKGDGSRADVIDHFFARMKERGFRIWLAATNDVGEAMPDDVNIIDEPETAEAWKAAVASVTQKKGWRLRNNVARAWDARLEALALSRMRNVATHFNQYTGLRWCDDPLIAVWELSNEEWWMRRMVGGRWQKLPKFFKNQLVERWNSFLKAKYGSDTALRAAWKGLLPGEKLADASVVLAPMAGKTNTQLSINDSNPHALAALKGLKQEYTRADFDRQRGADVLEFFLCLQVQHKRREAAALKSWGKSTRLCPLVYDTGIGYEIHSQFIHQSADAVAHDAYVNGWGMTPNSSPDDAPNAHEKRRLIQAAERMGANRGVWNNWLLKPPGISQGVPWLEHNRVEGKPFLCYETQIQQPAKYRADFPLRLLALASIQDWDAICWHYWGSAKDPTGERAWERPMDVTTGRHPQGYHYTWDEVQSAMMRAAGHMFRAGVYKPAPNPTRFIYGSKSLYDPAAMDYGGSYGRTGLDMLYTTYQYGVRIRIDPTQLEDKVIGPVVSFDDRHKHNPYTPTDEIEFDWKKGIATMDAPSGAAFAGLMANAGETIEFKNGVKLSDVKIHNPEDIYDPVGDEKYISFALYSKDGKTLQDTESAALSLVSTSFNSGFRMWAEDKELRKTPEGRPRKGTLPVLVARVSGVVEAPMLSGMKYTLLDWHMDKVGEGVVADGKVVVPGDKPVFVIELEREPETDEAWNGEYQFPENAGIVNVRDHGAKGDGTTDDTAALRKAIRFSIENSNRYASPKFIYVPRGIYLVSGPLESRVAPDGWSGGWRAGMLLVGESREHTIIKLKDNAEGYGEPANPKWVIATGSESDKRTKAGDKPLSGGGNRAFRHSVINLTVDVGKGNPGAKGIDYVASNRGTIESVTIRSSDPGRAGHTGLALTRNWPGPCLIKDVLIEGFDRGIEASHYQYSVTFENVTLRNQLQVGVLNKQNVLAFRGLTSENAVPVVRSTSEHGTIIIVEGSLRGGDAAATAIESQAELYLRDLQVEGYGKAVMSKRKKETHEIPAKNGASKIDFFTTEAIGMGVEKAEPMRLPVKDTPTYWTNDHRRWVCPQQYLEPPDQKPTDWSDALQAAVDSGKPVVYLPNGSYQISRTLEVPPYVRLILGFQSAITVGKENKDKVDPAIRFVGAGGTSTTVEHLWITGHVEHDAGRAVAFRHCDLHGRYQNTKRGAGDFFTEDTIGPKPFLISHPQNVWCRQLNIEFGEKPLIENHGGNLWALMFKTEGQMICLKQTAGKTELLGGLLYTLRNVQGGTPSFQIVEGEAALTYSMNGPGYPNEVRMTSSEGDATLKNKRTVGRSTGLVRVKSGPLVEVAGEFLDRIELFDGGIPFWSGRPGASASRMDQAGNTWTFVAVGGTHDMARPQNWKPLKWGRISQRWEGSKLSDQAPSYSAQRVLRGRPSGGKLAGVTFQPAKAGLYRLTGKALVDTWNPNGSALVVAQVVDADNNIRPVLKQELKDRSTIDWSKIEQVQSIKLDKGDRLFLSFAAIRGQTGSMRLEVDKTPTGITEVEE